MTDGGSRTVRFDSRVLVRPRTVTLYSPTSAQVSRRASEDRSPPRASSTHSACHRFPVTSLTAQQPLQLRLVQRPHLLGTRARTANTHEPAHQPPSI